MEVREHWKKKPHQKSKDKFTQSHLHPNWPRSSEVTVFLIRTRFQGLLNKHKVTCPVVEVVFTDITAHKPTELLLTWMDFIYYIYYKCIIWAQLYPFKFCKLTWQNFDYKSSKKKLKWVKISWNNFVHTHPQTRTSCAEDNSVSFLHIQPPAFDVAPIWICSHKHRGHKGTAWQQRWKISFHCSPPFLLLAITILTAP